MRLESKPSIDTCTGTELQTRLTSSTTFPKKSGGTGVLTLTFTIEDKNHGKQEDFNIKALTFWTAGYV